MSEIHVEFEKLPSATCVVSWSTDHVPVVLGEKNTLVLRLLSGSMADLRAVVRQMPEWLTPDLVGRKAVIRDGQLQEVQAA